MKTVQGMSLFVLIVLDLYLGKAVGGIGISWGIKHVVVEDLIIITSSKLLWLFSGEIVQENLN